MSTQLFVLLLIGTVLIGYGAIALTTRLRLRGTRVVVCPETHEPAAVTLDTGHAAVTAVWEKADLRLATCSRWPEREGCDQACVPQIVEGGDETRAKTIAAHFFEGKHCAICQQTLDGVHAGQLQPGLLDPITMHVLAWDEVPPQELPEDFGSWQAVCPNCTLAESFRRRFPDRVVDRIPRPGSTTPQ
jgi:hypothetical protein